MFQAVVVIVLCVHYQIIFILEWFSTLGQSMFSAPNLKALGASSRLQRQVADGHGSHRCGHGLLSCHRCWSRWWWFLPSLPKNWYQAEIRNWRRLKLLFRSFQHMTLLWQFLSRVNIHFGGHRCRVLFPFQEGFLARVSDIKKHKKRIKETNKCIFQCWFYKEAHKT